MAKPKHPTHRVPRPPLGLPDKDALAAYIAEAGETEAVVYALFEPAAQARLALDEQHVRTVFVRGDGGREPAGAAADDDDVVHHACTSPDFVGPNVMGASAEDLRTALSGTPRYSAMMRTTCGEQNPP